MPTNVDDVPLLTQNPNRSDGEENYSTIADAWAGSLNAFNVGMNTSISQINLVASEINADAVSAAASAAIATAAADAVPWVSGDPVTENLGYISQINFLAYRCKNSLTGGANTEDPALDTDLTNFTPMIRIVGDPAPELIADLLMNGNAFKETAYNQIADASPATGTTHNFDYENGDLQEITCPAAGTLTIDFINFPAGKWAGMQFVLINPGNCTLDFGASTEFAAKTLPNFTVSGKDILQAEEDKDGVRTIFVRAQNVGTV